MDIESFIKNEKNYFAPMQSRALKVTEQQRAQWKRESVAERQERISLEVYDLTEGVVRYGPFAGMRLARTAWWGASDLGAQCLGLYEPEILALLGGLPKSGRNTFIDIGAADGYYTTGMLFSKMVERAICFELSESGRETISHNWIKNGSPGALEIFGEASELSITAIDPVALGQAIVLADIEGAEFSVFSDAVFTALKGSIIILEVHNWVPDFDTLYAELLRRGNEYFDIEIVGRQSASSLDMPELRDFTDDNRLLLQSERRPCVMRFLKFTPKP